MIKKFYERVVYFLKKPRRYKQLFKIIRKIKPKIIVEVGTWRGARAVKMIEAASKFRNAEEITYYGFDLFEDLTEQKFREEISKKPPPMSVVEKKLEDTGANIKLYKGDTVQIMPKAVKKIPTADFVFIDGGHSYKTVLSDWENVQKLMDEETVVVFDDYWVNRKDGPRQVVDNIDISLFDVEVLPVTDTFPDSGFGELVVRFAKVQKKP